MKAIIAIAMTSVICGCAFPQSIYKWDKTSEALPQSTHIIPQIAVQAYCGNPSFHVMACAYRDYNHCYIVTAYNPLSEVLQKHEEMHCAGWTHQSLHTDNEVNNEQN